MVIYILQTVTVSNAITEMDTLQLSHKYLREVPKFAYKKRHQRQSLNPIITQPGLTAP